MAVDMDLYVHELARVCDAYGVKRLGVFGSAFPGGFDPERSDIDFLVEFSEEYSFGAFERYFGLKEAPERLFQRPVDLVEERAIRNPYFREAIEQGKVLVYETGS
jgi:predicted nucleotidyltransferase